jgi:hypothetical protein
MKVKTVVCFLGCGLLALPVNAQILGKGSLGGGVVGGASSTGAAAAAGGTASTSGAVTSRTTGQAGLGGQASTGAVDQLQSSPHLYSRAQGMLGAGSSVQSAAAGFQNQSDFFAAARASQNLKVPFDQLKANIKGSGSASLEAAIRKTRPDLSKADVKTNVQLAQSQAAQVLAAAHVEDQLSAKAGVAARAQGMLPAGTDMATAVYGFQDAHDFVMAEHVSQNMNIPFDQLKASVSGQEHAQFQTAAAHLRPDLDAATIKSNMKTATEETNADFKASGRAGADAQTGGGYAQTSAGASAQAQAGAGNK